MTRKMKKNLIRIIVSLVLFLIIFIIDKIVNLSTIIEGEYGWLLCFGLYFGVYVLIGYDVIKKAVINIFHGQVFDENFLMCVATIGSFALAIYRGFNKLEIEGFDEACAVLLFYQVGEFFQTYATGKSRKSISSLMDIRPDYANIYINGKLEKVDPSKIKINDIIVVKPGEKVPLDGIIKKGSSYLDTKALTGESMPLTVNEGSTVLSGTVNITSVIEIEVKKEFYDSTATKILDLIENASTKKAKVENFITKFARYYTPIVCSIALLLVLIPGIITTNWSDWLYRGLSFLVVSCPCALVISIPMSFFAGLGAASKYHILIKGSNYLEQLNKSNIFVFDKTGTLTKGNFAITKIEPIERKKEIIHLAAIAEKNSNHPIAKSILNYCNDENIEDYVIENINGRGIIAKNNNDTILCGNASLLKDNNVDFTETNGVGTIIYVSLNNEYVGSILISDEIKEESKEVIKSLNEMNSKTIMLTGDNKSVAESVANILNLTSYKYSLLPADKVEELDKIIKEKDSKDVVCFLGDGINDAPVLMRSDIGIAMGSLGSDAAIEASDVVLMNDDLKDIIIAKKIAKKTMQIVFENIIFSIAVKVIILILAAMGIANMWIAVFGDVGVAIIAILNAMRASSLK